VTPFPEKGDVRRAVEAMNRRVEAAMDMDEGTTPGLIDIGTTRVDAGATSGDGANVMRRIHGDLVDTGEFVDVAVGWAHPLVSAMARGAVDPVSALVSLSIQAVAFGALMERQRWERES
jgi:hypothetical protein